MKRILLFIATNFAILIILGIILNIVLPLLGVHLQDTAGLLIISAVFGMGGSFISLAISKWVAKRSVGAYVIEQPHNAQEHWLLKTVAIQATKAGVGMPEVAIYDSPEINAFATGMNKNNALVAVSSGLLNNMTADEAEAVLGHEMSHIANGDMVTMTLLQGVMNTFVFFFARIVARAVSRGSDNQFVYFMTVIAFQIIFGILASIVVMWFSRYREFRADAGGANLAGREKMINALKRLQGDKVESQLDGQLVAFGISGKQAFSELLMSHPPLEKRIKALQRQA
ncbi:protease HtpX [Psychromonas sp. MB-3u-54]|uniref:protease HtpX n=1 Tax=Psychromonas sp. MB-3u-54 TaxID=2058319 RepID=UPI000C32ED85|nr:protease HtpX [Psychromonas sp. MB-3u-54]PKH01882.1 protease HtpX [Psychromonas sp. MB-3u-54]